MKRNQLYILCIFLFSHTAVCAQTQQDSLLQPKTQIKLSLNYNSNLNYYGRTDSLRSTGFFPMAELWITPGFYINAAPVFINNKLQAFDYAGTVTTMGFQKSTAAWFSHFYIMKPFYKAHSPLVQSALKAQSGVSVTQLNPFINVTAGADVKWSRKTDLGATAGVDHIFRIEKQNRVLVVDPSVYVYAGTQQFSKTYMIRKKGGLLQPPTQQQATETKTAFNILAFEVSLPVIYAWGGWQAIATPSFVAPKNLLQVSGRPDLSETGQAMFYATLTLKHSF